MISTFKYIYGPVYSWRLGRSLGVDPLSSKEKICNMDCVYCQLGRTAVLSHERREYIPTQAVLDEIKTIPEFFIDYITFSGRGEPTLAQNLGAMIRGVKKIRREKIAVITNSSLLCRADVQDDLMSADFVLAKLDASSQKMFDSIDGECGIDYDEMIRGIGLFRERYKGKFALQIMVIQDNVEHLKKLGALAFLLNPHEVQLNTPLRASSTPPLGREQLHKAKTFFRGIPVISCYDAPQETIVPLDNRATASRHGNKRN